MEPVHRTWRETARLVGRAGQRWLQDGASREGAALAFYATLSLAPFLFVLATVAAFFLGTEGARTLVLHQGGAIVGTEGGALLAQMLKGANSEAKGWAALIGLGSTLAGATAGFSELQSALNRIFVAPEPRHGVVGLAMTRVLSLLLVIGAGLVLVMSLALTAVVSRGLEWLGRFGEIAQVAALAGNELVTLIVATFSFGLVLMVLPDRRVPWRLALRGGFLAALLFQAAKFLIGWYIGRAAGAAVYGAAAALVVLMLWIYFSAQVFLLGAEFAAVLLQDQRERLARAGAEASQAVAGAPYMR